jgi:hypothetical protein
MELSAGRLNPKSPNSPKSPEKQVPPGSPLRAKLLDLHNKLCREETVKFLWGLSGSGEWRGWSAALLDEFREIYAPALVRTRRQIVSELFEWFVRVSRVSRCRLTSGIRPSASR